MLDDATEIYDLAFDYGNIFESQLAQPVPALHILDFVDWLNSAC